MKTLEEELTPTEFCRLCDAAGVEAASAFIDVHEFVSGYSTLLYRALYTGMSFHEVTKMETAVRGRMAVVLKQARERRNDG